MSPSPIASPIGWAGVHEQLWLIHGLQASIFLHKNDGEDGDVVNGMTLRKRKSRGDGASERSKKKVKASGVVGHKENGTFGVVHRDAEGAVEAAGGEMTAPDNLEYAIGDEHAAAAHAPSSDPAPDPTRRSARQAHRRAATASVTATPTPDLAPAALPAIEEAPQDLATRRIASRARSSSSAVSGSTTAVSESGSMADTCVDEDEGRPAKKRRTSQNKKGKPQRQQRADEQEKDTEEKVLEEELKVRASTRVRKLAPKKAQAIAQEEEEEEQQQQQETHAANGLETGKVKEKEPSLMDVVLKQHATKKARSRARARR